MPYFGFPTSPSGGGNPRVSIVDVLSSSSTISTNAANGGSATALAGYNGFLIKRGTTANGGASILNPTGQYIEPVYDKNPQIWFSFVDEQFAAGNTYQTYLTFDYCGAASAAIPTLAKYFGFKIKNNNGTHELYSVHCDGTNAEVSTLLSGVTWGFNTHTVGAVMTSGTSIKFFVDGTLAATHTLNLPTGPQSGQALWEVIGVGSAGTTDQNMIVLQAAGVSYDL